MPLKQPKVITDILNIKGGGVYCFLPFERVDKNGKAVYKIGVAGDFTKRNDNYHTYFPLGVYLVAFLINPIFRPTTRWEQEKRKKDKNTFYKQIEKFIIDKVIENGGERIYTSTRTRFEKDGYGGTEWVYADENEIHKVFEEAKKKFGGRTELYYVKNNINKTARARETAKPNYIGEIVYPLENK